MDICRNCGKPVCITDITCPHCHVLLQHDSVSAADVIRAVDESFIPMKPYCSDQADGQGVCPLEYPGDKTLTDVIGKAAALINGDRKDDYGDAKESFGRIAKLWSAYLGHNVSSYDVALMMSLLKISRASHKYTEDCIVDLIGYAALAAEVRE